MLQFWLKQSYYLYRKQFQEQKLWYANTASPDKTYLVYAKYKLIWKQAYKNPERTNYNWRR